MFRRASFLGIVTAAALLFGQLSGVVHLLAVDHQRCPEHGELVHGPPSAASPLIAAGAVAPRRAAAPAASWQASERDDAHAHDHCLCLVSRRAAALVAVDVGAATEPRLANRTASADVPRPAPTPLWILAPKNSPPLAV